MHICILMDMSRSEVYTAILLRFLLHLSTTSSKSLSVSFVGDSMVIFIWLSSEWLQRRFIINFISAKLCSADAVETGIDMHVECYATGLANCCLA